MEKSLHASGRTALKKYQRARGLQRPTDVDPVLLYERFSTVLSSIGFSTSRRYNLGIDLQVIYNQAIATILDLNTFLETAESDPDAALDAIAFLNEHLHDLSFHMRSSRAARQRLQLHLAEQT